jgi:hypothetical protein
MISPGVPGGVLATVFNVVLASGTVQSLYGRFAEFGIEISCW